MGVMEHAALILLLAAWGDWPEAHVVAHGEPTTLERRAALDDMQRSLDQWQRERREFGQEQRLQAAAVRGREVGGRVVREAVPVETHVGQGHSKVIELKKDRLQGELEEAEEAVKAHQAECARNPQPCREREKQAEVVDQGNAAWDRAAEANREKRDQQIEEDARRYQAQLDAAKRREEERAAKKLGGKLDSEGNFVDEDLR
jgi:hypothetical protein